MSLFALLLLAAWPARAAFNSSSAGTAAAPFLELGVDARQTAMGDVGAAAAVGPSAMYYNPAGMVQLQHAGVTLMYASYLADTNYQYLSFAAKADPMDAWGISIKRFSAGSITERDTTGASLGGVTPTDLAASFGWSRWFTAKGWGPMTGGSVGATVSYVNSQLVDSASTFTMGLGLKTHSYWDQKLKFGLSVNQLFGKLTFDQQGDSLPLVARFGAVAAPAPGWLLALDGVLESDASPWPAAGLEYRAGPLGLRAGYNGGADSGLGALTGVSGGFGLTIGQWTFDYALVPFGDLGTTHRLSLSFFF